jgi:hypothetical protein
MRECRHGILRLYPIRDASRLVERTDELGVGMLDVIEGS